MPSRILSISRWKRSGALAILKGNLLNTKHPTGVIIVMTSWEAGGTETCQQPEFASRVSLCSGFYLLRTSSVHHIIVLGLFVVRVPLLLKSTGLSLPPPPSAVTVLAESKGAQLTCLQEVGGLDGEWEEKTVQKDHKDKQVWRGRRR